MSAPLPGQTDARLLRGISRWALVAFAVNLTVGAGILGLQGRIQALVGNYSVLVIAASGLLIALIGLCFAEVASRFDRSGGPQLYASVAMGPVAGFTVGWLLWISRIGSCAVVSNLLVDYAMVLWPSLGTPLGRALTISTLALCYLAINIRGIRQTAVVSTAFTVCKLLPLIAFVAVGAFFVDPHVFRLGPLPTVGDASSAVLLAGAALVLGQTGTFAEKMTAGRGFMAIAIVVLGRYHPVRVLLASLLFGAAMALQFVLQSRSTGVPYQAYLMLPYLLTLMVLVAASGEWKSVKPRQSADEQ